MVKGVIEAAQVGDEEIGGGGSLDLARRIARIAHGKGASEIVGLRVGEVVAYTDLLVIATARNERMASAIADEVRYRMKQEGDGVPRGADGVAATGWQAMDYGDCVLHILTPEARDRYRLEELWREAPPAELGLPDSAEEA